MCLCLFRRRGVQTSERGSGRWRLLQRRGFQILCRLLRPVAAHRGGGCQQGDGSDATHSQTRCITEQYDFYAGNRPHPSTLMALGGTKTAEFLKGTRHPKLQSSHVSSPSSSTCVVHLSSLQSNATKWSSAHRAQKSWLKWKNQSVADVRQRRAPAQSCWLCKICHVFISLSKFSLMPAILFPTWQRL